jgi:hypothetical protein
MVTENALGLLHFAKHCHNRTEHSKQEQVSTSYLVDLNRAPAGLADSQKAQHANYSFPIIQIIHQLGNVSVFD